MARPGKKSGKEAFSPAPGRGAHGRRCLERCASLGAGRGRRLPAGGEGAVGVPPRPPPPRRGPRQVEDRPAGASGSRPPAGYFGRSCCRREQRGRSRSFPTGAWKAPVLLLRGVAGSLPRLPAPGAAALPGRWVRGAWRRGCPSLSGYAPARKRGSGEAGRGARRYIMRRVVVKARKETEEGDAVAGRAPGSPLHGTTLKRGTVAQAEKLREKRDLKPADFSPKGDRQECPSRGVGGRAETGGGAGLPEAHRAAACSPDGLSRGQGHPFRCHHSHMGPEGRGGCDFPLMPAGREGCFPLLFSFRTKDVI
ncbi:collagen alpha-1(I) chain-like [Rissa tridactyla]|uniref:collagen alpha-1(I) chain-like n=1 Tax=Rissa tridactyla TaxID=75485 RepID=UPI0023BA6088|nr:collagen alpha-1(I) chain-like [Rissa tridactyla]